MKKIGSSIRKIRKTLGMTQVELAEKLGTTQYVITNWERELSNPPAAKLPELAKVLGVPISELYGGQSAPQDVDTKKPSERSRSVQIQKLFEELKPNDQRTVLKLAQSLKK